MERILYGVGLFVLGFVIALIAGEFSAIYTPALVLALVGIIWTIIAIIKSIINKIPGGSNSFDEESKNDLFKELDKGSKIYIKDGYIFGPNNYRLGSITNSKVVSHRKYIGNVSGDDIIGLDGNIICRIENGHLIK
jgi:xanthosine utilization system XapX-like protein